MRVFFKQILLQSFLYYEKRCIFTVGRNICTYLQWSLANTFLASGRFCRLLIVFANSLDTSESKKRNSLFGHLLIFFLQNIAFSTNSFLIRILSEYEAVWTNLVPRLFSNIISRHCTSWQRSFKGTNKSLDQD